MRLTKLSSAAACVLAALVAYPQSASAATYVLPIMLVGEANGNIFKITVDNGEIRRLGSKDGVFFYEADMEGNSCSTSVRVIFSETELPTATVPYNVCSEQGIAISIGRE
jgi:hypothetical protein